MHSSARCMVINRWCHLQKLGARPFMCLLPATSPAAFAARVNEA